MCFAPQPRAIFGTSELPKWVRECGVLCILTCKCAFRHSGVRFFACLRNSCLRTLRFSEPTFRTAETTNHWKNTAIRDVPNIFRACTFFLVTLHACWSSISGLDISTLLDTSTLLFNSAYCRKLDFSTSFDYIHPKTDLASQNIPNPCQARCFSTSGSKAWCGVAGVENDKYPS